MFQDEALSSVINEKRAQANALCQQLVKLERRRTYFHTLVDMSNKLDEFIDECGVSY